MSVRYAKVLTVVLTLGTAFTYAQSCTVPSAEAVRVFGLADSFGDGVTATPFDDASAFPWWLHDAESVPVAVIEDIHLDTTTAEPQLMLDAQHLDGNDFVASVPYAGLARAWKCE